MISYLERHKTKGRLPEKAKAHHGWLSMLQRNNTDNTLCSEKNTHSHFLLYLHE